MLSVFRRFTVCCACVLFLAGSATAGFAAPDPEIAPDIEAPRTDPGAAVADVAQQYIGSPYRFGGTSPAGFDCTGFVLFVYSQFGISLPHNEAGQLASGPQVGADDLQPGDVLVFANTYRAGLSHTGIYIGDGQFVHAADERHGVIVSALSNSYWSQRLVGATRAVT